MALELKSELNNCDVSVAFEDQHFHEESYFSGDELGFDFPDDLSVQSDVIFSVVSTSYSSERVPLFIDVVGSSSMEDDKSVVKSVTGKTKRGSKFMRKKAAPYPPKSALMPKATSTGIRTAQPNMSRRTRDTMLYAFPSFDRCDSLLFFPSTMARLMNNGDISAVVKLFVSHIDKNCAIKGKMEQGLNVSAFAHKMWLMEEMQPDRITCFRHTQVDGNKIKAVGYTKFTKCRAIYDAVARMLDHKPESKGFKRPWKEHLLSKLDHMLIDRPSEEIERYLTLIESDCDLVVYYRMNMELTIDNHTNKVQSFDMKVTLTSLEEVKYETAQAVV